MMNEEQKYVNLDKVLQEINRMHVALDKQEKQRNMVILNKFIENIIGDMRRNFLFNDRYREIFYGGSYYDALKVSKPDEFDLDVVLKLPKLTRPKLYTTSDEYPGYVKVQLQTVREYEKQSYAAPDFAKTFLDDKSYLSTEKVLNWMTKLVDKALNSAQKTLCTSYGDFKLTRKLGGPAITVTLWGSCDGVPLTMSIDLVPCFVFTSIDWPKRPFRQNEVDEKNEFLVVPKRPPGNNQQDLTKYWRFSFQEQEGCLMKGYYHLKPTLKLIKRLRDVWDHNCICSYYIKTIFLWEVEKNKTLWDKPLSYVFVTMLKKYKEAIESCKIEYYWDPKHNLIHRVSYSTLINFANKIQRVINDIENFPEEPRRVVKHFVKPVKENILPPRDKFNVIIENLDMNVIKQNVVAENDSYCTLV